MKHAENRCAHAPKMHQMSTIIQTPHRGIRDALAALDVADSPDPHNPTTQMGRRVYVQIQVGSTRGANLI